MKLPCKNPSARRIRNFHKRWEISPEFPTHKKIFSVNFELVQNLLKAGICITDLKPGNSLHDAEYERGMLIDLAGVVKAGSSKTLRKFKAKYVKN